jgi:hypothetical protein
MRSQRFFQEFALIFLLVVTIGIIAFQTNLNFTGFVVGPNGEQCDGTWTCGNWGTCVDSNQTRECTSTDSLNCTSPINEIQSCTVENTSCVENWTCSEWNTCANDSQTRTCTDSASCGTTEDKPEESQSCNIVCTYDLSYSAWSSCSNGNKTRTLTNTSSCEGTITTTEYQACTEEITCSEHWDCGNWSTCSNGNQTRTCTDSASCGTSVNKPSIKRECTSSTTTSASTTTVTTPVTAEVIQTSCTPSLQCGDWQECINESQIRICTDTNNCNPEEVASTESQACVVEIKETCFDKIKNQDETGIDCGGKCKNCGILTIVGSAISGTVNSVLGDKTKALIFSGVAFILVAGFVAYRLFFTKKKRLARKK